MISASTIKQLRKKMPHTTLCQYANDNPFSKKANFNLWNKYIKSIKYFDLHFAYREIDIKSYLKYGAKDVTLLRSYFIPEEDYPVDKKQIPSKFRSDVVFAGHYEDDCRVEMLEAICDAGFKLNLYGGGWDRAKSKLKPQSPLLKLFPISPCVGEEYRYAICGSKVALCFLSTLNQDSYTRRNFQIPAMKVAVLSQYTKDLSTLFEPNKEMVFFKNKIELIEQLNKLISQKEYRDSIAKSGFEAVYKNNHDVKSRIMEWVNVIEKHQHRIMQKP